MEIEWGVGDGDGWRLLCGCSSVGVGSDPSDGALGVVDWGDCSGGVDVGDGRPKLVPREREGFEHQSGERNQHNQAQICERET